MLCGLSLEKAMKIRSFRFTLVLVLVAACESIASAQAPAPPPPPTPAPDTPPPPPGAPAAGAPATTPPGPPAAEPAGGPEKPAPAATIAPKWYDVIAFDAFVDAYASLNYNFPKPQGLTLGVGGNQYRAFDVNNGFALNWVGINASATPDPVGGTISLRAGPGARIYAGNDNQYGLEIIKQAFASWKPGGKDGTFTIDFGKYDQPYGSEVAETQFNMNYSRSALFNYAQPLFFTGFRFDWQATDKLDLKLILANGWNNSVAQNYGKTAGIQVNFKPNADTLLSAGYAVGPQQTDGTLSTLAPGPGTAAFNPPVTNGSDISNLRHLVDAIVDVTVASKLRFLLNGDFVSENGVVKADGTTGSASWYGVNLGVRYAISDPIGISVRGEYFADPEGVATGTHLKNTAIIDGTATLEGKITPNLILKLEQRLDVITNDPDVEVFRKKANESSKTQMTTMLGVVVKTN